MDKNDGKTAQQTLQDMATACFITKQEGMKINEMSCQYGKLTKEK